MSRAIEEVAQAIEDVAFIIGMLVIGAALAALGIISVGVVSGLLDLWGRCHG